MSTPQTTALREMAPTLNSTLIHFDSGTGSNGEKDSESTEKELSQYSPILAAARPRKPPSSPFPGRNAIKFGYYTNEVRKCW